MREGKKTILICGYGSMGTKYHELIRNNWKDVRIVLLTSQKLDEKKIGSNIEIVRDLSSAISKDCTHAIIANAATLHVEYACRLLESGINTLIEKPLLTDDGQCQTEKLIKLKNKEKAFVGYVLRQDKIIQKIKEIIECGELGELISIEAKCGSWLPDWRPNRNYGNIEVKHGWTKNTGILDIETVDIASITGVTKKDVIVNIGIDFCSKPAKRCGEIKLSKGSISYDLINRMVMITEYNNGKSNEYKIPQDSKEKLMKQIEYLLENQTYQRRDFCSIEEGIEVVNVIRKVKKK